MFNYLRMQDKNTGILMTCAIMTCAVIVCCTLPALAQGPSTTSKSSEQLFSPSVGQIFYDIAYDLAKESASAVNSKVEINVADKIKQMQQRQQAIIFLTATINLDSRANYVLPDMINLAYQYSDTDYSSLVYQLLLGYISESADLEVTRKAVGYLLDRLNSREEREKLLKDMITSVSDKNAVLESELYTLLGILTAEKADLKTAQLYLMKAYSSNKYNKLAFSKLVELAPEQIDPVMYLEHLRLSLSENPFDIDSAMAFAQYADRLQLYQTAMDAYEYCVNLFGYLYPSQPLPAAIYLPWAISSYNTQRDQHKCLQIAEQVRQSGRFDLLLEAIAGKAAAKIGNAALSAQILQAAENKATRLIAGSGRLGGNEPNSQGQKNEFEGTRQTVSYVQLAWFYCFALQDSDKAIEWANKAYSVEPNSATSAAILAYSFVFNGQSDWAKPLIENYKTNQIAILAKAQIQLEQGQKDSAIETLKSAIAVDPGSLEAGRAKEVLAQNQAEYIPPIDPDIILTALRNDFKQAIVPAFITPEKLISAQLNFRGSKFSYGTEFSGTVAITNNSSGPIIISDDGLLKGNIRVDADISGDLKEKIPNLVSVKIRPTLPVESGRSLVVPLRFATSDLRRLLLTYPQASLDIEFTVYIDPVVADNGEVTDSLGNIKPAKAIIKRPGIELDTKYLRNRFVSLSKGQQGQKIKTAQLFIGLLMEQNAMANREPLYKFMYADWIPAMLKSAVLNSLADDDWIVKAHTMTAMDALPLDYDLISAVAKNLDDTHWPVRLIGVFLLAKSQDVNFGKVLDWTAEYDSNQLVREMAIALGGARPKPKPIPPKTPVTAAPADSNAK